MRLRAHWMLFLVGCEDPAEPLWLEPRVTGLNAAPEVTLDLPTSETYQTEEDLVQALVWLSDDRDEPPDLDVEVYVDGVAVDDWEPVTPQGALRGPIAVPFTGETHVTLSVQDTAGAQTDLRLTVSRTP